MPLQLLPQWSRGGPQQAIPMTLGTTNKIQPATPDFAGSPTYRRSFKLQNSSKQFIKDKHSSNDKLKSNCKKNKN